jgi:hypothetical protein
MSKSKKKSPTDLQTGFGVALRGARICPHLDHLLGPLGGLLEEELHGRRQQLQLHLGGLLGERLQERLQQLVRIVDAVRVLADDPDHGRLGLGLVQGVEGLAQRGDDGFVPV